MKERWTCDIWNTARRRLTYTHCHDNNINLNIIVVTIITFSHPKYYIYSCHGFIFIVDQERLFKIDNKTSELWWPWVAHLIFFFFLLPWFVRTWMKVKATMIMWSFIKGFFVFFVFLSSIDGQTNGLTVTNSNSQVR